MKSIIDRFSIIKKENPFWSSYLCFAETVKGRGCPRFEITKMFNKLVEKNDYFKGERDMVVDFLVRFGKCQN